MAKYIVTEEQAQFIAKHMGIFTGREMVECKDCKWYKESKYSELRPMRFCYRLRNDKDVRVGYNWDENDFCSRGERREDEAD